MSVALSVQQFKDALPDKMKKSIDQKVIDGVNALLTDPNLAEQYRDNLIGYTSVMKDGKFKAESYIHAVKYVTQKVSGKTNLDSYVATFPDKYQDFLARGVSQKDIASYICAYNKGKLVNLILEQTLVPNWILNQDMYQAALRTQHELMTTSQSDKVRCEAANSILTHLKMPEKFKVELELGEKTGGVMEGLRAATLKLADAQRQAIELGVSTVLQVAESRLVIDQDVTDA